MIFIEKYKERIDLFYWENKYLDAASQTTKGKIKLNLVCDLVVLKLTHNNLKCISIIFT